MMVMDSTSETVSPPKLPRSWCLITAMEGLREQQAFFYKPDQGAAITEKPTSHVKVTTETVRMQGER